MLMKNHIAHAAVSTSPKRHHLIIQFHHNILHNAYVFVSFDASNLFRVFGCAPGSTEATSLEASKNPMRRQVPTPSRPSRSLGNSLTRVVRRGAEITGVDANGNSFDFTTKLLHLAWHPSENSIACAAANSLYMYYA
ncbi:unnamed protein product [Trifolium pratense]|uniref:Uncharacterized protein n=1 Tax=Trifolium pratense TaxID=57577 RepID=A0ACB0IZC3_TRIPR|nr:unnamed protein product [Trifolium pratense]